MGRGLVVSVLTLLIVRANASLPPPYSIILIDAKKIKDGSRWIESNDISLIKEGKWYVSYAALQEARGQ